MSMFQADASQLRRLGAELRKTRPEVHRAVRRSVLEQAKKIAEDAKTKADWSTRIPGTIRASSSGVNTAVVRAGGPSAPHAAAYEHAGAEGTFRHPVYGRGDETRDQWTWVSEQARPFLHPALMDRFDETVIALRDAVEVAVSDVIDRKV